MLWHRAADKEKSIWIAVTPDGERVKTPSGRYITRYEPVAGAAYYNPSHAKLDPDAKPEALPGGFEADSPEGIISRFCFTPEARGDWAWLDGWKRRKSTGLSHIGCGEGQWPEVPVTLPLTCPRCGVLKGDAAVYAEYHLVSSVEGESVKVCVFEAWITGKHHEYSLGKRPVPSRSSRTTAPPAGAPDSHYGTDAPPAPSGPSTVVLLSVLVVVAMFAGAYVVFS